MINRIYSPLINLISVDTVIKGTVTVVYTTGIWTSNAHGLSDGDVVLLSNGGGALPAGASATTKYFVKIINANTFYLYTDSGLANILAVTDNGSGTNSFNLQCKVVNVQDYENVQVDVDTTGNANFTLKCQVSNEDTCPDFSAAQSTTNIWKYIQLKNLNDGTSINGSDGIVPTGTDINTSYELNLNGARWLSFDFTAWVAGKVRLSVKGYGNV